MDGYQPLHDQAHHDGSALYVPEPPTAVGQQFDAFLRVPSGSAATRVLARQVQDGEPALVSARLDRTDNQGNRWYRATLTQANPLMRYRFLTDDGPNRYRWVTAAGIRDHDPSDAGDFLSSIYPGAPSWVAESVAYQIFPDRFARSGQVSGPLPEWAVHAPWTDPTRAAGGPQGARVMYGGNLSGVVDHLDHLSSLGATLLYLTPVFPATSNHRYDASTFAHIDPLLGGDAAYRDLIAEAHRRGMRVLGDFTTNHTGSAHEWFVGCAG